MDSFGLSVYVEWLSVLQRAPKEKQNRVGRASGITSYFLWKHLKVERIWKSSCSWTNNFTVPSSSAQGQSFLKCLIFSLYHESAPLIPPSRFVLMLLPIAQMLLTSFHKSKSENFLSPFITCSSPQIVHEASIRAIAGVGEQVALFPVFHGASESEEIAVLIAGINLFTSLQ